MVGIIRAATLGLLAAVAAGAAPAAAAPPALAGPVAFVRDGDVFVGDGAGVRRVTEGGGFRRPRWSPEHRRLAVLRGDAAYTLRADGGGLRRVTARPVSGAAWSPDGRWLALASRDCVGGTGVYRVPADGGALQVLFPAACRGQAIPAAPPVGPAAGSLTERLRRDDALAWSPDGARVAFRGGDCESVLDDCLTLGTVATGAERLVAGYGGGGVAASGFAVTPAFRPDGAALAYTGWADGPAPGQDVALTVRQQALSGAAAATTLGAPLDREPAWVDAGRLLVTGQHRGGSWVVLLAGGQRHPLYRGSQPAY